jgi:hypothetical protein
MAFKKTVELLGIEVKDAYIKAHHVTVYKDNMTVEMVWKAKPETTILKNKNYSLEYNINGNNPIAQAYMHLKNHPDFENAIDC